LSDLRGHDHEQETRSEKEGRVAEGGDAGAPIGAEAAPGAGRCARTEGHQEDGESRAQNGAQGCTEGDRTPRASGRRS
jgi:hypothetical protein